MTKNPDFLFSFIEKNWIAYSLIGICAGIVLIPSYNTGFLGDDLIWIVHAKEGSQVSWVTYLTEYEVLGYFRPFTLSVFRVLWNVFNDLVIWYHIFITILHIFCSILIFTLLLKLNYGKVTAFLSSIFFGALACHAETLYSISCLNEIFSCIFILLGLHFYVSGKNAVSKFFIITFLSLALLSRESALCFIAVLIVVKFKLTERKWSEILVLTLIPLIVYIAVRILLGFTFPFSQTLKNTAVFDYNPITIVYKVFHYFTNMLFPVRAISGLVSDELRETIKLAYLYPSEFPFAFAVLLLSLLFIFGISVYTVVHHLKLRVELLFPVLFAISAMIVYLPLRGTAERFLYLPSAGASLLIAIICYESLKYNRKAVYILIILFTLIHSASLYYRAIVYNYAFKDTSVFLESLYSQTKGLQKNANILLTDFPRPLRGIYFISTNNFKYIWKYHYPNNEYSFLFKDSHLNNFVMIDAVFAYDTGSLQFRRVTGDK